MRLKHALALAVMVLPTAPASAFMLYPDRDDPDAIVVLIEQPYGELVPFRALPKPFDTPVQMAQGPERFSYRWLYGPPLRVAPKPPQQEGLAFLTVDEDGVGTMHFEFFGEGFTSGEIFGAAAVLVDAEEQALHTFYTRADISTDLEDGSKRPRAGLGVARPPAWWRRVEGIVFFNMKYQPGRFADNDRAWIAMRQAVERITGGKGTEQHGMAVAAAAD
jgi:hypothetical protein